MPNENGSSAIRVDGPVNEAGTTMSFETGRLAQLADGAVVVQLGDTTLLSTVVTSKPREGIDFFPLTVDVEERMYAAGKIPGSFFRREGRPGEQAILTCRLTDRPLRPSFPDGFRNEVQVIATILGADLENPHDVASINGASAALMVSGIPFNGPIGAVRIAQRRRRVDRAPHLPGGRRVDLRDGRRRSQAPRRRRRDHDGRGRRHRRPRGSSTQEGAPKVTEEVIADGLECVEAVDQRVDRSPARARATRSRRRNGPIETIEYEPRVDYQPDAFDAVADDGARRDVGGDADRRQERPQRAPRRDRVGGHRDAGRQRRRARRVRRPRRRAQEGVPLAPEAGRAHAHRERGRAHRRPRHRRHPPALGRRRHHPDRARHRACSSGARRRCSASSTLGMPRMEQMLDTIGIDDRKRYMHHYNFPPFSTGETGRVGSPKRREIGHGALAERALVPVLPSADGVAVHDARRLRRARRRTAPPRWRRCAARRSR